MSFLLALILAVWSYMLAAPVPQKLAQAKWPARHPALALFLWQAIALSGGLSIVGTFFCLGAGFDIFFLKFIFGGIGSLILFKLCYQLIKEIYESNLERNKHKHLLYLLTEETANNTRIVNHDSPVAYCLPGIRSSVTVLSQGLLDTLNNEELDAVRLHEAAHLTQHHHWLTVAFSAWKKSLPFLPSAQLAYSNVATLIEILADNNAVKKYQPRTVAQALVNTAGTSMNPLRSPDFEYQETTPTGERIKSLLTPQKPLSILQQGMIVCISIVMVCVPLASVAYILQDSI